MTILYATEIICLQKKRKTDDAVNCKPSLHSKLCLHRAKKLPACPVFI